MAPASARVFARRVSCTVALLAFAAPSRSASADPVATAPPAAIAPPAAADLFRQAQELFDKERYAEACIRFDASHALEPRLGTLLNLAFCHEREGKTATARAEFEKGALWAASKGQREREDFARDHLMRLDRRMSLIQLEIRDREHVSHVVLDGTAVPQGSWGTPLPLDPGHHVLIVRGRKKKPQKIKLNIGPGPSTELILIQPLDDDLEEIARITADEIELRDRESSVGQRRNVGLAIAGAGVVTVGVGLALGIVTLNKRDQVGFHCVGDRCDETGLALYRSAHSFATASTVLWATGLAAVAGGVIVWLSSPSPTVGVRPVVGHNEGGLSFEALW